MNKADLILLPYSQESYSVQTSGIFTEALSMGKPVIVTDDTWMSYELKYFNCYSNNLCFKNNNFEEFYKCFISITQNINNYKSKFEILKYKWNGYHSPENFFVILNRL